MIKRKLYVSIILLAIINDSALGQIEMGIRGALNVPCLIASSSKYPTSKDYRNIFVPGAAVQAEYDFSKNFSLHIRLEYAIEGGEKNGMQPFAATSRFKELVPAGEDVSLLYANYYSRLKIHYIMLPVQAKFTVPLSRHWNVFFAGGLFVSHSVAARNKTSGYSLIYLDDKQTRILSQSLQSFEGDENIKSKLRHFNAGLTESMGFSYSVKRHKLFFETGGNFGFVNIYNSKSFGSNHTGTLTASIGYSLYFFLPDRHIIYQ